MPTLPRDPADGPRPAAAQAPHQARSVAESFGTDAHRYDRARPAYPAALLTRLTATDPTAAPPAPPAPPGPPAPAPSPTPLSVLDIGTGTGIAARQFQAAGCSVLGVEPDARMAGLARSRGLPVEIATFETWEPVGRTFDLVVAAQSWHWVDPVAGAEKVAELLRPGGRFAIFGHVYEPPAALAEPLAAALRRVAPGSPLSGQPARRPLSLYEAGYEKYAATLRATGHFAAPEQWRFDWEQSCTREEWLDLLPTTGGLTRLAPAQLSEVLREVGTAIDGLGGRFTMPWTTLATTAIRTSAGGHPTP
ncbi:class I SAM-dependent methyltransferase [Streptomyces sp. NPDC088923]|uniref:class I SAM-dependent methyltransferase n=1 Tax=Streptomyces sp. NPDC088923 TaxID=3365913 RepID=UPI003804A11C